MGNLRGEGENKIAVSPFYARISFWFPKVFQTRLSPEVPSATVSTKDTGSRLLFTWSENCCLWRLAVGVLGRWKGGQTSVSD